MLSILNTDKTMLIKVLVVVFSLIVCSPYVNALKCYECASTKDWTTCNKAASETECTLGVSSCLKLKITAVGTSYAEHKKLCSNACSEDKFTLCGKTVQGLEYKCEINCCTGDLCNTSSTLSISYLLITLCTLFTIIFT